MNEFYWFYQRTRFHGINWIPGNFGRVMIIVHGIGEHIGRYDHVASFFMQEGYAVIGIDHYGHGQSDGAKGASRGGHLCLITCRALSAMWKTLTRSRW